MENWERILRSLPKGGIFVERNEKSLCGADFGNHAVGSGCRSGLEHHALLDGGLSALFQAGPKPGPAGSGYFPEPLRQTAQPFAGL